SLMKDSVDSNQFRLHLFDLSHKLDNSTISKYIDSKALTELKDYLDLLKTTVSQRISDFIIEKIQHLSEWSKTEITHQIGQALILKYEYLYSFVVKNDPKTAAKIYSEYISAIMPLINKMSDDYKNLFFQLDLNNLELKYFSILFDDTDQTSGSGLQSSLSLGNRHLICESKQFIESALSIDDLMSKNYEGSLYFEQVFKCLNSHLLIISEFEYGFLEEFLRVEKKSCAAVFSQLFDYSFEVFIKINKYIINKCGDIIGLMIAVHLIKILQTKAMHEGVYSNLEDYWSTIEKLIWTRIKSILEFHIKSLANANPKKYTAITMKPYYISVRYSEIACSIIYLINILEFTYLQREMIKSWFRSSFKKFDELVSQIAEKGYPTGHRRMLAFVFRVVNIGLVRSSMQAVNNKSKSAVDKSGISSTISQNLGDYSDVNDQNNANTLGYYEMICINEVYTASINSFAHFILDKYVGYIFKFVEVNESINAVELPDKTKDKLREINSQFKKEWKEVLISIKLNVKATFSNQAVYDDVLGSVFEYFLSYYHRLHKIIFQINDKSLLPTPSLHQIILEIKTLKYDEEDA
ncbi:MAG: Vacuolar protein sorting-associated protein 52, partial [Paramarteilia canceri]